MIEIRLNNFLFNSGVLGLYKILMHEKRENCILKKENNVLVLKEEFLEDFDQAYIDTMLDTYEEDTKWFSLTNRKLEIQNLDLQKEESQKALEEFIKFLKKSMESASYKAGYEIVKTEDPFNPYSILGKIKTEENLKEKQKAVIEIIEYLERNRKTYAMKDIMYTKITMFWENVAFLNRNTNKNDIQKEYKKGFVDPAKKYLEKENKSDYTCIECGNRVGKSESFGLSWLKDTGVDINRKKSGFWNFQEDAFLCPICNLIYSCVPLGFTIVNRSAIFINQNNSMKQLVEDNKAIMAKQSLGETTLEKMEQELFLKKIQAFEQLAETKTAKEEAHNIQVIKRIENENGNQIYEFNLISKKKLEQFYRVKGNFENLIGKYMTINKNGVCIYETVMQNFMENKNQYGILDKIIHQMINNNRKINYLNDILEIQVNSIGGMEVEEEKELRNLKEEIKEAGKYLQIYYFKEGENENKLKAYILKLSNSLRTNNAEMFIDIVTRMYGSLGKKLPAANAFEKMLTDKKYFRVLGYSYIIGLEGVIKGGK